MNKKIIYYVLVIVTLLISPAHGRVDEGKKVSTLIYSCFKFYLNGLDKNSERTLKGLKKNCLTPQFGKEWLKRKKAIDADPLLQAQHIGDGWKAKIRIDDIDLKNNKAKVFLGSGLEIACRQLSLKKINSNWRIDSSVECLNN